MNVHNLKAYWLELKGASDNDSGLVIAEIPMEAVSAASKYFEKYADHINTTSLEVDFREAKLVKDYRLDHKPYCVDFHRSAHQDCIVFASVERDVWLWVVDNHGGNHSVHVYEAPCRVIDPDGNIIHNPKK